ncbi:hypothetical protein CPHO_08495 [Corynebacterium phocae]|uniref:Uncharacterized protein n=1 Tax=Corynebacterium phocae TaxID=161895 RepID=A0A1L7D4C4_9CORY|nr:hypothetical protein [Corynebacterium phocae]APT92917.1 hypothetical protein CPHO_08495 [Corynebacterium phocae]KAA8723247.1 hypothetical protein F4V58_07995 [Corynebacterium phocae]
MTTKTVRPRRGTPDPRVRQLQDQLRKRTRFDVLIFIFGVLVGVALYGLMILPPPGLAHYCSALGGLS